MSQGRGRWVAATVSAVAALVFAVVAIVISWRLSSGRWWLDAGMRTWGIVAIGVAVVVWLRAPNPRVGQLMLLIAASYHLAFLRGSTVGWVLGLGLCGAYLWTAVLNHLLHAWPTGLLTSRSQRVLVVAGYGSAVGSQIVRYLVDRPHMPTAFGVPEPNTAAAKAGSVLFAVLTAATIAVMARRWARSSRLHRRPGEPVWAYVAVTGVIGVLISMISFVDGSPRYETPLLLFALLLAITVVPAIHLIQRRRNRDTTWRLARVALDLERSRDDSFTPRSLERALAGAVGDPGLRLLYPVDGAGYVDGDGHRVALGPTPGRTTTPVHRRGRLFALIEHDTALAAQRSVAEAAGAAAGLALENAQMYATMRAQIEEIGESRLRIATSAATERRRIQRDLHDGAQQEFFAVLALLDMAMHRLSTGDTATGEADGLQTVRRAHRQLGAGIASLRLLTEGLYPVTLADHGIAWAVQNLVELSPIPVKMDVDTARYDPSVEVTAYFVMAEALANVYKHAAADLVTVSFGPVGPRLVVRVEDDGCGGADPVGSGLRSLADRIAAVGGTMSVTDGIPGGTVLTASFPLESSCVSSS